MEISHKSFVHAACRRMLRPIASMLLRCGMTWKEFSDLSKSVFVQAATDEFGIRGRPTNVSRVSILTGISRKEVKRQRDLLFADPSAVKGKTTDATRVLSGWFQDPDYLNGDSQPLHLAESGPAPSFESLCWKYGGDIAAATMLKELIKTKAIERLTSGELKVLSRYYQPAAADDENLRFAVDRIHDVVETMNNNVFLEEASQPRFGGFAANDAIPVNIIPEFYEYLDKRGQAFLEEVDDWLTQHADDSEQARFSTARVGISLFATEERISEES
jgi:Family of unknown function (DUF6502)